MNKSFWKNKKVLITGDTGFKGAWLTLSLHRAGAQIQGFSSSDFNTNFNLYKSLKLHNISNTIDGDIRNQKSLMRVFDDFQPEIVFHLAAQPLVRESYVDPVTTYDINIMGTINILEAIRNSKSIESAVMVTTDKCYENNEWEFGYREIDPLGGHDPYSSSKGCAELVIKSYQKSFFNDQHYSPSVSSVRAGNVIGGGDFSKDRLIPDLYNALIKNEELILRNPLSTRPWQHVLEPLYGYIKVAETAYEDKSLSNDCWNFGPHITDIRTVHDVTELFCSSWGG
jgi:CDP-glucose 4,6-dehydratase